MLDTEGVLGFVLDATNTGVWTWDIASDLVRWSQEAYRIHGMKPEEFGGTGAAFFELVHPDDRGRVHEAVSRAVGERSLYSAEFRIVRPDGSIRVVTNQGRASYDEQGAIVVGTISDVTERERERRELHDQLQEERNRLAMVLNNISEEIWFHDAAGRVLLANPTAERGFGKVEGFEITSLSRDIEFYRSDGTPRPPGESPILRALTGEEIRDLEEIVRVPLMAELRTRCVSSIPVRGQDGSVLGAVSVVRDITERSMADRALARNRARLEYATRLSGVGFWYCDLPFDVLEWDDRVKEHFFFDPTARITIHDFYARLHPEDREATREAIETSIRNRAPYDIVYRTVQPSTGEIKWIRALGGTDYAADGSPIHFDGVTVDVSAQKRDEERLAALNLQLREYDRRKDEFIATLSHELRNPLAPIRAAAQVIAAPRTPPAQLQRAQAIVERQVRHMGALLDDLLDVARITQNKLQLKKTRVSLNEVMDAAVETVRPSLSAKHHQLSVSLPAAPVVLWADPIRVSQILSNLMLNASKYSDSGSQIALTAAVDGTTLTLSVRDNGIGIAADSISGIFEIFSQVEKDRDRSEGGLGIGLALVKGLAELHGGTVEARSEGLGLGSEFIVQLPLAMPDSATVPAPGLPVPIEQPRRRVLIADDNEDAAESLSMLLELAGHEVQVAHDGKSALSRAETFQPEFAVLDIGMPKLNGYDVARLVREQPWGAKIRLIAVTGWGSDHDRQRTLEAGFDHHLTKPIDPDELQKIVATGAPD
jgi:PAS domain S-box-containing protein